MDKTEQYKNNKNLKIHNYISKKKIMEDCME